MRALCARRPRWQAALLQVSSTATRSTSYHRPARGSWQHQGVVVAGGALAMRAARGLESPNVMRETRRGAGFRRRTNRDSTTTRIEDADLGGAGSWEEMPDPEELQLPPGIDTENMTMDEIQALAEGYRLVKASAPKEEKPVYEKVDLSYLYAASNDPKDHHPEHEQFRMSSIYTIPNDEYDKLFPGLTVKHKVPFDSSIHRLMDRRFLMIRPQGVQLIQQLKEFAGDRYPKTAEAESLREEWIKSGRSVTTMQKPKGAETGRGKVTEAKKEKQERVGEEDGEHKKEEQRAAKDVAKAAGGVESEVDEDEYDLFGADEDTAEEADRQKGLRPPGAETEVKKRDIEILGTLKRLAVDENFVHPDQTFELPLTSAPSKDGGNSKKTITVLSGRRGVGKSAALYHAVHYARKHGWIVLLIPSARELLHEAGYVKPSTHFKGYFDAPDVSQSLLGQWYQAHGHQLSQIPVDDSAILSRYGLSQGVTAADLATVGLTNPKVVSSVVVDLKTVVEKQKDYPVLVAIDEVDEWYHPSSYYYALRKIEADRLAVVRVFKDLIPVKPDEVGGHHNHLVVLAARTGKYPRLKKDKKVAKAMKPLPRLTCYDLGVSNLSSEEFDSMYKFMGAVGLWEGEFRPNSREIAMARFKTCANPTILFKEAATLDGRLFAPQNRVGKASDFAPRDLMLQDLVPQEVTPSQQAASS